MPRFAAKIGAFLKEKNLREQNLPFKGSPYSKEAKYLMLMPLYYINIFLLHVTHKCNVLNECNA